MTGAYPRSMRSRVVVWSGLSAALVLASVVACSSSDQAPVTEAETTATFVRSDVAREAPQTTDAVQDAVADNVGKFAFDLYGELRKEPGNVFFSPFSITSAFAMAWAGAKGDTATDIAKVLHFDAGDGTHAALNALDTAMRSNTPGFDVSFANALWVASSVRPLPSYLDTLAVNYGAGVGVVDFGAPSARETINAWVSDETHAKIPELLQDGDLSPVTTSVLTNAVYFKAKWETPFETAQTSDGAFTPPTGDPFKVPMMHRTDGMRAIITDDLSAVALPYDTRGDRQFEMVAVVPKGEFDAFEATFDPARLRETIEGMTTASTSLTFPKFDFESRFHLKPTLEALGMKAPFVDGDFSGMSEPAPGSIYNVVHQGSITLTEEGTEAAAATAILTKDASIDLTEPRAVTFNRPFLIFIRHLESGTVLFMGRVENPAE